MTLSRRSMMAGALGCALAQATTLPGHAETRHEVSIRDFAFEPGNLTVKPGDQIRFTNHDLAPHTATASDGSWDTGTLEQGQSATLMVTADWSPSYFCAFHPAMTATLLIG